MPEPPVELSVLQENGTAQIRWKDGLSGGIYGDEPTGYRIYTSADGRSWDNGSVTTDPFYDLTLTNGQLTFVRVAALNDGGVSFPSEVLAVPGFKMLHLF